ncbi:MAG TPA: chemotaxis protein CheB [Vicinamibacterales bacterium]|nr:chemotaxis protein CheB [Vicinamibacterales bacterium]
MSGIPADERRPDWLVGIAASAGGIGAIRTILAALPLDLPAAVVLLQHRSPIRQDGMGAVLTRGTPWQIRLAAAGEPLRTGQIYLARPDRHLIVSPDRTFEYRDGTKIKFVRSSANPLFASAARVFEGRFIAVVLTGGGSDATDGVQEVKACGGVVIAQDPATAEHWSMPRSAIASGAVDYVLPIDAIAPAIAHLVRGEAVPAVSGGIA